MKIYAQDPEFPLFANWWSAKGFARSGLLCKVKKFRCGGVYQSKSVVRTW